MQCRLNLLIGWQGMKASCDFGFQEEITEKIHFIFNFPLILKEKHEKMDKFTNFHPFLFEYTFSSFFGPLLSSSWPQPNVTRRSFYGDCLEFCQFHEAKKTGNAELRFGNDHCEVRKLDSFNVLTYRIW